MALSLANEVERVRNFEKARHFATEERGAMENISLLYRNQPDGHWAAVWEAGKEEVWEKIDSGHNSHPLWGGMSGIFFGATLWNGAIPTLSNFGGKRKVVPVTTLLNDCHLYFSDFYCWKRHEDRVHYVAIIACRPNSDEDIHCEESGLIRLEVGDNPFLCRGQDGGWRAAHSGSNGRKLWLEIFYTHDIPVHHYQEDPIPQHMRDYKLSDHLKGFSVPVVKFGY